MKAIRNSVDNLLGGNESNPSNLALRLQKSVREVCRGEDQAPIRQNAIDTLLAWSAPSCYVAAQKVRRQRLQQAADTVLFTARTVSPLLCGFEHDTLIGFGFSFLQPWGVPYLPGSSVKGCVSTRLAKVGSGTLSGAPERRGVDAANLLGGRTEPHGLVSGCVDFLEAWWVPCENKSPFMTDIVNPHYGKYYQGERWPDGMESPIPFKFAAIRPGETFCFTIQGPSEWTTLAKTILLDALSNHGVGAKTRIGYGRFAEV